MYMEKGQTQLIPDDSVFPTVSSLKTVMSNSTFRNFHRNCHVVYIKNTFDTLCFSSHMSNLSET